MDVNSDWTFEDIVKKIKTIRLQYEEVLSSFSSFEIKLMNDFIRITKHNIYNLDLAEWKKDRLWEFMNGNIEYFVLESIMEREKYGTRTKRKA